MDLLKLIDLVYRAAVDPMEWSPAMTAIADALAARACSLTIVDPRGSSPPFVVAPRSEPEWLKSYVDRWAASNLVRERGLALPLGEVYDSENLGMPRAEFDRTPFYNEFWAPQRINFALLTIAAMEAEAVSAVGFYRSAKDGRFGDEQARLLATVAPHVRRAVALTLQFARIQMQRDSAVEVLDRCDHGVLLVDGQARVLFATAAAEAILSDATALRTSDGRLAARQACDTVALRAMIAGGARGAGGLVLTGPDGVKLIVEVVPLSAETSWLSRSPKAMVFVRDPRSNELPSAAQVQLMFDLTPAQAALARELLHGDGIPAAAERLGVSRSTARTQLLELFQKTGSRRQAELVRLILQQRPISGANRSDDRGNREPDRRQRPSWLASVPG